MKLVFSVLIVLTIGIETHCQKLICQETIKLSSPRYFTAVWSWADNEGYILTSFQFTDNYYVLYLVHRERGVISRFEGSFEISEIIGATSSENELTLFFKGYAHGKRDSFFVSFLFLKIFDIKFFNAPKIEFLLFL